MYRIHSCTLTGFKRMLLNNIRKITITPTMAVQLILGTNGSGKSSLLEQLSPLPANAADFIKCGSKVWVAYLDGRKVTCTSTFDGGSGHHSFDVDGEELNPGGTIGVQKELAQTWFGVTPQSHDLMRGAEKFTNMNPAKRREWLTAMCEADYTFAMAAYDKLKERANWLTGAVKMNKKNLVVETAKIMSEAEETKLEEEVTELLKELGILQAERAPIGTPSHVLLGERNRALKALDDVAMRLLRQRVAVPFEYADGRLERDEWGGRKKAFFKSVEEIDAEINRLNHIVTDRQAVLVTLNEQFNKYQKQYDLLMKTGAEGVDGLNRQISDLRSEVGEHVKKMRLGLVFPNASAAREALDHIEQPLTAAIASLPINSDRRYGRQRHQELQDQLLKMANHIRELQDTLQRKIAQKEHADQHRGKDKHTCPQCHHTWQVGVNEEQYAQLLVAIQQAEVALKAPMEEREQLAATIKEIESYFDKYREVIAFTKNVAVLKPFWDELTLSQNLFEAPNEAINMVYQVQMDLQHAVEVQGLEERIQELEKLKVAAAEAGDAKLEDVRGSMDALTASLGQLTGELSEVTRALADYNEYRKQIRQGLEMAQEVKRLYALAEQHQWDHIEAFRLECIQNCINQVEQALAIKQEALRAAKMQKAVVAKLQEQLSRDEVHEAAAKTMVKALSPTHGLIAQGLLGFIRNFVGEMNTFIGRIWTYPLQVIPTGYDSENEEQSVELDYRFKMIVERENNIVPDVSKGSEGIKEMVDLAFKMISIKYLGLSDTPLFLDEFGKSLDDEHRFRATEEIRWMMENGNHPQLFMISHYAASYTAFTNSEICVIDDRNITVPAGRVYNKHVHIVH